MSWEVDGRVEGLTITGHSVILEGDVPVAYVADPVDVPVITAAPDLLRACHRAMELLTAIRYRGGRTAEIIQKAINKAEGKS